MERSQVSKFINLLPLPVYRDRIPLDPNYRNELVAIVLDTGVENARTTSDTGAWLGDTKGHEFLFQKTETF